MNVTQRSFDMQKFWHTENFTQRLLHRETFNHRSFYTEKQELVHRASFVTKKLSQTEAFIQSKLLHREAFSHSKLCHGGAFTHRNFTRQPMKHRSFLHREAFKLNKLCHREAFTHSKLLHKEIFTESTCARRCLCSVSHSKLCTRNVPQECPSIALNYKVCSKHIPLVSLGSTGRANSKNLKINYDELLL